MTITVKRLEEIQSCLIGFFACAGIRKNPKVIDDELYEMATELLSLREQKRRLIEDANGLANILPTLKRFVIGVQYSENSDFAQLINQLEIKHESLMKELDA